MIQNNNNQKLEKIVDIMLEMSKTNESNDLLVKLKKGASELTNCDRVEALIIDHNTGSFVVNNNKKFQSSLGITGLAIKEEKPIRANDISKSKWQKYYIEFYPDTRSEIVLPLVIDGVTVRKNTELSTGSKVLGVLNIESSDINAFSEEDERQLWLLARHAAILLDKCEYNDKINRLRVIEREIAKEDDYEKLMELIINGIVKTLKFQFVNISLIEDSRIRSKFILGLSDDDERKFKEMANHSLSAGNKDEVIDISAYIAKHKIIEVLDKYDARLDRKIFDTFGHKNYIRVFLPMIIVSSNKVLGTLEASYPKEYRKNIYEQDIELLENFVSYATQTLELRKYSRTARIIHELKSPVVGIKSHASFMQRRWRDAELSDNLIEKKFEDIITDSSILIYLINKMDYFFRARSIKKQSFKIEGFLIFRDIIIKTVHQLRPNIIDRGFSILDVEYPDDCNRIYIFSDKAKINQVVYNILINSIKYAKKDPNQFKIKIEVDDKKNSLCIKFKDWGIGIDREDQENIFEEGFRSKEAIKNTVVGSGLGLTIARNIMRQFGGDLILNSLYKPTEFQMLLPKKSKEDLENDLVHR